MVNSFCRASQSCCSEFCFSFHDSYLLLALSSKDASLLHDCPQISHPITPITWSKLSLCSSQLNDACTKYRKSRCNFICHHRNEQGSHKNFKYDYSGKSPLIPLNTESMLICLVDWLNRPASDFMGFIHWGWDANQRSKWSQGHKITQMYYFLNTKNAKLIWILNVLTISTRFLEHLAILLQLYLYLYYLYYNINLTGVLFYFIKYFYLNSGHC